MVTDVLAGEYHSIFKGRGMEFSEVREYQMGDDIRTIDWNVTSRTGTLHVKKFVEERELTVLLMLDASASADFGTTSRFKREVAAEIGAHSVPSRTTTGSGQSFSPTKSRCSSPRARAGLTCCG
jgi:uncharacterized protein (DUF58 family)